VVIPSVSLGNGLISDTLSAADDLAGMDTTSPTAFGPQASLADSGLRGGVTLNPAPGDDDPLDLTEILAADHGGRRYITAGEVARGGMGAVLRAVDRDLHREVAMKVLLRANQPLARDRFVEEAQVAGQLEHPNIVPVHDIGVDADGRLFFTMKLVKGRSLADVLETLREPEPSEDAPSLRRLLRTYLGVLNAIAFAHDRGVVHRDLKPANIMLGDYGEVLVMDWGLARVIRGEQGTRRHVAHRPAKATTGVAADARLATIVHGFLTQADGGPIEGTPAYMPPEQARGDLSAIDERSDIYSLGAILYEILTLSPPVRGTTLRTVLEDVVAHRILAPEERAPARQIPKDLSAIAMKALAADRAERYQSAGELRRDIELFLEDRAVSAKEDSPLEMMIKLVRRNQEVSIAIGVSVIVVIVLTIVLFAAIVKERHRFQKAAEQAKQNFQTLQQEQQHRVLDQRRAAPALVARARRGIDRKEFDEARQDAALAREYDPALGEALLLNAHLAIHDRKWADAVAVLNDYRARNPDDTGAAELLRLCGTLITGNEPDAGVLTHLADLLVDEGAFTIAEGLYQDGRALVSAYRVRLERTWPGCTRTGFSADADGRLTIEGLAGRTDVSDLTPLTTLPIARLSLAGTRILDLSPLKGMPLRFLDVSDTPLRSLDPLVDLPLNDLRLARTRVDDLAPLHNLPLANLDLTATLVADLSPLTDIPLATLVLDATPVEDLQPLRGMPLKELRLYSTRVADLRPLLEPRGPGATLERLSLPRGTPLGLEGLRKLPKLQKIAPTWQGSWLKALDAADYWTRQPLLPVR
jgi:serine/threonine protein kinase